MQHYLDMPIDNNAASWLLSQFDTNGGFLASPVLREVGMPDLLSTAVALHALALTGVSIEHIKEKCLDFLDSLWCDDGGFCGNWADRTLDCEYTFYGLLALGHLSEPR
jgi:prenyltransferase beta subunit